MQLNKHAMKLSLPVFAQLLLGIATLSAIANPLNSQACTLNASLITGGSVLTGGATAGADSVSSMLGASLTVDIGTYVDAGVFYDYNFLSYAGMGNGSLRFYGALLRVGLLGHGSNLYVDTSIGATQRTGGSFDSATGLGLGAGLGYRFWLTPYLDLSPRLGARVLPEPYQGINYSSTTLDGNLLLTFEF
jgi:hypothetical protein